MGNRNSREEVSPASFLDRSHDDRDESTSDIDIGLFLTGSDEKENTISVITDNDDDVSSSYYYPYNWVTFEFYYNAVELLLLTKEVARSHNLCRDLVKVIFLMVRSHDSFVDTFELIS